MDAEAQTTLSNRVALEPLEHGGQGHRAAGRPGRQGLLLLFSGAQRPGPGAWGHADLWLAFQWAEQRPRSGGDVGRATVLAQGIGMAFEFSLSSYVPVLREGLSPRGGMKTRGTIASKSRKPLAKCPFKKRPGTAGPGPGPPPPRPRPSPPTHREAAPQALDTLLSGLGWAQSSRGVQPPAPPHLVFGSHFNILRCKCQGGLCDQRRGAPISRAD